MQNLPIPTPERFRLNEKKMYEGAKSSEKHQSEKRNLNKLRMKYQGKCSQSVTKSIENMELYENFSVKPEMRRNTNMNLSLAPSTTQANFYSTMSSYVSIISSNLSEETNVNQLYEKKKGKLIISSALKKYSFTEERKSEPQESINNMNMKRTRGNFSVLKSYFQGYMVTSDKTEEEEYDSLSIDLKAKQISRDINQFRILKEILQKKGFVTNYAIRKALPGIIENFHTNSVVSDLDGNERYSELIKIKVKSFRLTREKIDDLGMSWNSSEAESNTELVTSNQFTNLAWREE